MSSSSHQAASAAAATNSTWMGCNVYISAASRQQASVLVKLLQQTQDHCATSILRKETKEEVCDGGGGGVVVVVHAFADPVYQRSSFHLASTSEGPLAHVVSRLVRNVYQELLHPSLNHDDTASTSSASAHPFVGLVDHIAVMPILSLKQSTTTNNNNSTTGSTLEKETNNERDYQPATPWGRTARAIGGNLSSLGNNTTILYYGDADPQQTPLATVRKSKTDFFQSGGLSQNLMNNNSQQQQEEEQKKDVLIVGAPSQFVENYNIRLTSNCSQGRARSLTQLVRQPGVIEALTLPYSLGRWEVACNLLQPHIATTATLDDKVQEWIQQQQQQQQQSANTDTTPPPQINPQEWWVETCYRVGTTAEQCLQALQLAMDKETNNNDNDNLEDHNARVRANFQEYLLATS